MGRGSPIMVVWIWMACFLLPPSLCEPWWKLADRFDIDLPKHFNDSRPIIMLHFRKVCESVLCCVVLWCVVFKYTYQLVWRDKHVCDGAEGGYEGTMEVAEL